MKEKAFIENWKLCDYKYCPQIVYRLIEHQISIQMSISQLMNACSKVFDVSNTRMILEIVKEHQQDIQDCKGVYGNSVYLLLNYGLSRNMIKQFLFQRIDLAELLFLNQKEIINIVKVSPYTAKKILDASRFALHTLIDDSDSMKQKVLKEDVQSFFSSLEDSISLSDLMDQMLWRSGKELLVRILSELVDENIIDCTNDTYRNVHVLPSLSEAINSIEDTSLQQKVFSYLNHKRLKPQDRIHSQQIIDSFPVLKEDMYKDLLEKYDLKEEEFYQITNAMKPTYSYIQLRYGSDKEKIAVNGRTWTYLISKEVSINPNKLKNYLENHYFLYQNVWVSRKDRSELLKAVCRSFDGYFTKKEGIERFNQVLLEVYPQKYYEWKLDDLSSFSYDYILHSLKHGLRFRQMSKDLVLSILMDLDITKYHDTILSTKKLFEDNLDIMDKYDIRDQYELHSLLRIGKEKYQVDFNEMSFSYMPMLQFGSGNEDKIIEQEIHKFAPISFSDFVKKMMDKYGYEEATFSKYLRNNFKLYIQNNVINVADTTLVESQEYDKLQALMDKDFYLNEEYEALIQDNHLSNDLLDPYVIRHLGYKKYVGYILKDTWNGLQFFEHWILEDPSIINDEKLMNLWSFSKTCSQLENQMDIIEVEKGRYEPLSNLDWKKEELVAYVQSLLEKVSFNDYFNDQSLKNDYLINNDFSNTFYKSILKSCREIQLLYLGNRWVFKKSDQEASVSDFLKSLIQPNMTISGLLALLKNRFGMSMDRHSLMERLKDSDIYYSVDTDRIYLEKPKETSFEQERLF